MKSGQPHQRYQANEKAKKEERERLERERRLRREIQVTGREKQLKAVQRMKNLQKKAEDGRNEKADEGRKGKGGVGRKGGDIEAGIGKKKSDAQKRKNRRRKEQSLPGWTSCEKGCLCLEFIHSSMISVWHGEINELFKLC